MRWFSRHGAGRGTFAHGIHPPANKHFSARRPIEVVPPPARVVLPLQQNIGGPCTPVVKPRQKVAWGDTVGQGEAFVSSPLHAPIAGKVERMAVATLPNGRHMPAIAISAEGDQTAGQALWDVLLGGDWPKDCIGIYDPQEIHEAILEAGIVGLGGAAFPMHVKLRPPADQPVDVLMVNGCECEPYLTSDHRTMLERPEYVHQGIRIVLRALGIRRAVIGIEANKPDAIEVMRDTAPDDLDIRVQPLEVKYPQGAEKMLIKAVTGREVPSGKLPSSVGALVQNVATTASVALVFETGQPLIERIMTISGRGIRRPGNWVIPFGTKLSDVIAASGGFTEDAAEIVFGGPMMGQSQASLDVPVLKATGGILVLSKDECKRQDILPCIRCGKCIDACPVFLNPQLMGALARVDRYEEMVENNLADCMLCGCCSFVCPSNIPLSQLFAMSKIQLSRLQAA